MRRTKTYPVKKARMGKKARPANLRVVNEITILLLRLIGVGI